MNHPKVGESDVDFLKRSGYLVEPYETTWEVSMKPTHLTPEELAYFAKTLGWWGTHLARYWLNDNTDFDCTATIGGYWQALHHYSWLNRLMMDDEEFLDFAMSQGYKR